jgi:hypothetical protein
VVIRVPDGPRTQSFINGPWISTAPADNDAQQAGLAVPAEREAAMLRAMVEVLRLDGAQRSPATLHSAGAHRPDPHGPRVGARPRDMAGPNL